MYGTQAECVARSGVVAEYSSLYTSACQSTGSTPPYLAVTCQGGVSIFWIPFFAFIFVVVIFTNLIPHSCIYMCSLLHVLLCCFLYHVGNNVAYKNYYRSNCTGTPSSVILIPATSTCGNLDDYDYVSGYAAYSCGLPAPGYTLHTYWPTAALSCQFYTFCMLAAYFLCGISGFLPRPLHRFLVQLQATVRHTTPLLFRRWSLVVVLKKYG